MEGINERDVAIFIDDIEDIDAHILGICARDGYDYRRLMDILVFCMEHSTK